MADYYGTLADADAYMQARGYAWTGTDADKEAALLRASQYIDGLSGAPVAGRPGCRTIFPGTKAGGRTQLRAWPRTGSVDRDGQPVGPDEVPQEVVYATYEAAYRELASPGSLSPDFTASSLVKREKVASLEVEYAVSESAGNSAIIPVVSSINSLLYSLLVTRCGGPAFFVV